MPTLDEHECRKRLGLARVGRLATVRPSGEPHVVPICFAVEGDRVVSAVDGKPKSTAALARLDNIAAHPSVSLLVDAWDEDWSRLWWVRVDGRARRADEADAEAAISLLEAKYAQYADVALDGAVILIEIDRWTGWSASPSGGNDA